MNITLEKAYEEDADILLYIQKQAFRPLYDLYLDEESPYCDTVDDIKWKINYKNGKYYKIFADGILCGGLFTFHIKDELYKMGQLYITPKEQCKGIGSKAILIAEQLEPDAKEWELDFPEDQIKNEMCYRKIGYVPLGKREVVNERLKLVFYHKKL